MKPLAALAFAGAISLAAHEAFHVATAKMVGGRNIEVRFSPFFENNDERRALLRTTWQGGRMWQGESDEVWAWALQIIIFFGVFAYLSRR